MLKKFLLTVTALVFAGGVAFGISGNQIGFPVANGPSYCGSFGNNSVCNLTVPAGPAITGNETLVANTNLANGANPQTVLLNMASMGALPYLYVGAPLAGTTTSLAATVGSLILDPTTTLATYFVNFPATPTLTDGQILRIASSTTITTLTLTAGAGSAISNNPTTIGSATCTAGTSPCGFEFLYSAPVTKWFRLQ